MNGIINVYKEKGFTSHDVVAKLRGILRQRRIGHTGTLDPEAEGVLPVCVGTATRLCDMLTDKTKIYEAVIRFGIATDTEDMTGTVVSELPVTCKKEDLEAVLPAFTGEQLQIPPMYSAIKVEGKKLYQLAREGKIIERQGRSIVIHKIELLQTVTEENGILTEATIRVTCGKGTYIRSLCRDIGERLGTCACMKSLIRLCSGNFKLEHSVRLSEIEEAVKNNEIEGLMLSVETIFAGCDCLKMKAEWNRLLHNGNHFSESVCQIEKTELNTQKGEWRQDVPSTWLRAYDSEGKFCGIYDYRKDSKEFVPVKMFLEG